MKSALFNCLLWIIPFILVSAAGFIESLSYLEYGLDKKIFFKAQNGVLGARRYAQTSSSPILRSIVLITFYGFDSQKPETKLAKDKNTYQKKHDPYGH